MAPRVPWLAVSPIGFCNVDLAAAMEIVHPSARPCGRAVMALAVADPCGPIPWRVRARRRRGRPPSAWSRPGKEGPLEASVDGSAVLPGRLVATSRPAAAPGPIVRLDSGSIRIQRRTSRSPTPTGATTAHRPSDLARLGRICCFHRPRQRSISRCTSLLAVPLRNSASNSASSGKAAHNPSRTVAGLAHGGEATVGLCEHELPDAGGCLRHCRQQVQPRRPPRVP